jgi:hypothetical protein
MPNALNLTESRQLDCLDRQRAWASASDAGRAPPASRSPAAIHFDSNTQDWPEPAAPARAKAAPKTAHLAAKSLQVTIVLDAAQVAAITAGHDQQRVPIAIQVAGRVIKAELSGKSARCGDRCRAQLPAQGAEASIGRRCRMTRPHALMLRWKSPEKGGIGPQHYRTARSRLRPHRGAWCW